MVTRLAFGAAEPMNLASTRLRPQARSLLFAAALAVTTLSCGSDSPSGPGPTGPGPGPDTQLECEVRNYPCSLSEVPLAVLERSDALGDEALAMIEAGAPTGEAAAWLEGQPDVAEVERDETAIWFRPQGGTGVWILGQGAVSPEFSSQTGPSAAPSNARAPRNYSALHVVGPDSEEKKALVLSPFHWIPAIKDIEDTPTVAAILSATRGYEGRVTYLANAESSSTTVSLESFMHWRDYQVIHISTHGKRVCTAAGCRATLVAGTLPNLLPPGSETKAQKLQTLTEPGLSWAKGVDTEDDLLVLNADFFRDRYKGGLDNTLVFLNTCQSFGPQATDLVDAIRGSTSVVFGWTEKVYVKDATAAAVALYDALSDGGYPARIALDEIGDLKVGSPHDDEPSPELRLSERGAGGDLRIREVVTLLNPSSSETLTASDLVPIQGTQGDGVPDAAPFLVRVEGVKPELATGMMVHVSIDGVEAEPVLLAGSQVSDEDQWTVSGLVQLSYDLTEDTPVNIRAWVNLHDGGESQHQTGATLTGEEPIMGTVWEMEAVQTFGWTASSGVPHTPYTATARLTLRFAPGQSPTEPHPRYIVTGGTVTYDYNHTYYDCTYSAPALTFEVTGDVSGESELRFDTTMNPVGYSGLIVTRGPEFEVTESCGEGGSTRTHRATNTWLLFDPGDARTVSGDRRSIVDTYRNENANGFFVESNYTIARTH